MTVLKELYLLIFQFCFKFSESYRASQHLCRILNRTKYWQWFIALRNSLTSLANLLNMTCVNVIWNINITFILTLCVSEKKRKYIKWDNNSKMASRNYTYKLVPNVAVHTTFKGESLNLRIYNELELILVDNSFMWSGILN